jgi:hypothetical protein
MAIVFHQNLNLDHELYNYRQIHGHKDIKNKPKVVLEIKLMLRYCDFLIILQILLCVSTNCKNIKQVKINTRKNA